MNTTWWRWTPPPLLLDVGLAAALCALDLLVSWNPTRTAGIPSWWVMTYAFAGYAALVARRRYPIATLFFMVAHSVLATFVFDGFIPTLGVWLALYTAAAQVERRQALLALLAAAVPAGLNVADAVARQLPEDRFTAFTTVLVSSTLFNGAIFGVGRWTRWSVRQRQLVADAAAENAIVLERARIARDLHDVVAHAITLMLLQAGGATRQMRTTPSRAEEALKHVDAIGQQAIVELRRLLGLLRVQGDDQGSGSLPGLARLHDLVARVSADNLLVVLEITGQPRELEPGVDLSAYRIIQEALTNATRYADHQEPIRVSLHWCPDQIEISVVNAVNNHARPRNYSMSTGHGLMVMRERIRSIGGTIQAGQQADGAFAVRVAIPTAHTSIDRLGT
ncbi:MAG: histidine kinase [Actinomycetota bacterium]|nr:histidine kinase [Actinomycetota bacterium]